MTLIKLNFAYTLLVYNAFVSYLKAADIGDTKMYGFSSDGAAVILGEQNVVILRLESQYMLHMHYLAHKLARSSLLILEDP